MKKVIALLLSVLMLVGMVPLSVAFAQSSADVTFTVEANKTQVNAGDEVTFSVYMDTDIPFTGIQADIAAPEGMTYVANSGSVPSFWLSELGFAEASFTELTKRITIAHYLPYTATEKLKVMEFKCIATEGSVDGLEVSITGIDVTDSNFDSLSFAVVPANVKVRVPVTAVTLDKETLALDTGDNKTATLVATVDPNKATDKTVTWDSSDKTVATVENGVVTALKHGTTTITVKTVDGGFTDVCVVTVTCAHTAKTLTNAKTANCQEGGWDAYYTCDACGQLFAADGTTKINAIPTTSKDGSNHTNIQPFAADTATCVHQGNNAYEKCVDCGVVTSGSDTKFYGDHNYGELKTAVDEKHTPDTLSPAVAAHYQCSLCNKYFTETKVETTLEALTGSTPSHSYGNWVNTDADQHWKECGCGNKIEVGDHKYDNTCDTTCNTCGHVRTITHSYSNTWSDDGTNHWHECTVCHDKKDLGTHTGGTATCQTKKECSVCHLTYGDFAPCDYVENHDAKYLVSKATCVAQAIYKKSCSVCGTAHATETFKYGTVDANNHVGGTYVEGQRESDCVTPGYTGDIKCQSCRQIITPGTDLPLGSDVPDSVWTTDATHHWKECKTVGCGNLIDKAEHSGGTATCKAKAVCTTCNVEYGTVNANNHVGETEIKGAASASCDQPGYTGDTWCKDCNTKIKDGEPIPAGHKTTEVPANPATHEAAGNIKYYTCSGCSLLFADAEAKTEIKAEDTVVAKGEHSYGEWVNTNAENHWKECACGNKIETAAHTYGDWTVTKESTTTEKGSKEKTCSVCGHKVTEDLPLAEATDKEPSSPQTGDNSNLLLWFVLLAISACGIVVLPLINKKRAR